MLCTSALLAPPSESPLVSLVLFVLWLFPFCRPVQYLRHVVPNLLHGRYAERATFRAVFYFVLCRTYIMRNVRCVNSVSRAPVFRPA